MTERLETVGFLARSENRVRVLETLAADSQTRARLQSETGIARATLGRVLSTLEDRRWIQREGQVYTATPQGRHLVREFRRFLDTVDALEALGDLVAYFPDQKVPFGLDRLGDATVTRPGPQDAIAPVRRNTSSFRTASRVVYLTDTYTPLTLEAHHEAVLERNQTLNLVFGEATVEAIRADPEVADLLTGLLAAETAAVHCYPGGIPYSIGLADETAAIGLRDANGAPQAFIETTDETVREWVESTVASYRAEATRLDDHRTS